MYKRKGTREHKQDEAGIWDGVNAAQDCTGEKKTGAAAMATIRGVNVSQLCLPVRPSIMYVVPTTAEETTGRTLLIAQHGAARDCGTVRVPAKQGYYLRSYRATVAEYLPTS